MAQKYNLILILGLVLSSIIITGCTTQVSNIQTNDNDANTITPQEAYCNNLVSALDTQIVDTMNPPGRFIISSLGENVGKVGGTLTEIRYNGLDGNYNSYTLTFTGNTALSGELYLLTTSNNMLPYNIGTFYEFDLQNINKYSAATSGMFIDNDLNKLTQVDCGNSSVEN